MEVFNYWKGALYEALATFDGFLTWKGDDDISDISLQMCSAVIVCPQVVYSSSARELKMETVKPAASEKEEDDIDIDAI